ncbi:MAG: AraC family transcriptional regulator ligand-binding domain-containing protein [Candidatus Binatia bacterium]|nr:AraC family transcriptional regulator ligand-binding domain-containing protein [Candidatus Binatia bacterium]
MRSARHVRVSGSAALPDFLRAQGVAPARVFAKAEMVPDEIETADKWIAMDRLASLYHASADELDDPWFGIRFGWATPIEDFGILSHVVLNAPDVRTGLENLARYAREYSLNALTFAGLEVQGDLGELGFSLPEDEQGRWSIVAECHMASVIRVFEKLVGKDSMVREVRFEHANSPGRGTAPPKIYAPTFFEAGMNSIVFEASLLDLPVVGADRTRMPAVQTRFRDLVRLSGGPLALRVGDVVATALYDGAPDIAMVARQLGISQRSLQRGLEECGTSYREVVQQVRLELSRSYLRDSRYQISEIAFLLGYGQVSSFTRAFKAATGVSPRAWRVLSQSTVSGS